MRTWILIAMLLVFIPAAVYAGDCNSCGKCKQTCSSCKSECKPKCDTCKPACDTCKPKCESKCNTCKPKCESKCNTCKPKCESKCNECKPKCESKCNECKPKCKQNSCSKCENKCNSCGEKASCAMPCACMDWEPYCGCGDLTGLCISMTACEGTAGPLTLLLRDESFNKIAEIELAGPIEGVYSIEYTFEKPMAASLLHEAVLINATEDPLTLTSLRVNAIMECNSWTYIDHTCPGAVIGPGGCPRMVLF